MRLISLGNACLLIDDEIASVLHEPGAFSRALERLRHPRLSWRHR